jgi:magnesium transporter
MEHARRSTADAPPKLVKAIPRPGGLASRAAYHKLAAMFTKRHGPPGSSPATLIPHLVDGEKRKPEIRVIEYDKDHLLEREIHDVSELRGQFDSHKTTWINLDGLGDTEALTLLGERFHIHPLVLEDMLNTGQRPKVEIADNYVFVVAQMVYHNSSRVLCGEQVSVIFGRNFLITVQEEGDFDVFDPVRERIRSGRGLIRKSKADYLAYALLDTIIDHYYPVLESLGSDIEELENALLQSPTREMVHTLHEYKRSLTQMRRFVWPLRDVVNGLLHDSSGFVTQPTRVFLRDCYDHTVQLMDLVESYKELTTSLMELYHSSVGLRTNEIMRVLTVITSIFIPLTFLAGIYGMNFAPESSTGEKFPLNMPELHSPYGYITLIAVMLVIAVIQLLLFRRMKWL